MYTLGPRNVFDFLNVRPSSLRGYFTFLVAVAYGVPCHQRSMKWRDASLLSKLKTASATAKIKEKEIRSASLFLRLTLNDAGFLVS